jgi:polyphosphate kinase 2 (PPK2 family)
VDLERHLHANGTLVVKFFPRPSKEEQRQRFPARIDEPDKNWKISRTDIKEPKFWKQYQTAYEERLNVLPADDKENARLIVSQIVVGTLEGVGMSYPKMSAQRTLELQSIRDGLAA